MTDSNNDWQPLKASFSKTAGSATLLAVCLPQLGYFAIRIDHQGGAYRAHPVAFEIGLREAMATAEKLAAPAD